MHWTFRFTVWMSLAVGALVAFNIFLAVDEALPAGTRSAFVVDRVDATSKEDALKAIRTAAEKSEHNIFKVQPDPDKSFDGRILYAFVGNAGSFEAEGGFEYPEFSDRLVATKIVSADSITTQDLRGRYVTDADLQQTAAILADLQDSGIAARSDTVGAAAVVTYALGRGNLSGSVAVVVVALALAASYSVAYNRKIYAVKALHGYRRVNNLWTELGGCTAVFATGLAGLVVVGTPVLWFYNHFRQAIPFFQVFGAVLAALYLLVLLLVGLAVVLLSDARVPSVLKGERASSWNAVSAATAQVVVVAVVFAIASAAMSRIDALERTLAAYDSWTRSDDLYALRVSTFVTRADEVRDAPALRATVADLEGDGNVLLAGYQGWSDTDSPPRGPEGSKSMIVNQRYLELQTVQDDQGGRIVGVPDGKNVFTLLIPRSYGGDSDTLLQQYTEYFKDFACIELEGDESSCDPKGSIIYTAAGQDLFTYNGTEYLAIEQQAPLSLRDPVLAVVSARSGLMASFKYFSYSSTDDLLFADAAALDEGLQEGGVRDTFQGIDNAADAVLASVARARWDIRADTTGLVIGSAVLVLATTVLATVYCDRRKRMLFVGLVHGYSFATRHWKYLLGTVVLACVAIGASAAIGHTTRVRDLAAAGVIAAVQAVLTLVIVRAYETRFRADLVKRY